ncbi:penicillin-binding transpeptidase domain-containing protein [Streptomyces sp. NPDC058572]|uniref:penicillin-binding transpeptidase domain-containing protein n=1 Tax=Streptomyces sp. NPDC058572 TaxID=3346546 RepID=UPI00364E965D
MKPTRRRRTVLPTVLALIPLLALGCSAQTDTDTDGADGAKGEGPSPGREGDAPRPVEGLGDIIVAGRPVTGSKPSGQAKLPYQRTYASGPLYAAVTGYRSMAYGQAGLEAVHNDVLSAGVKRRGSLSGHVVTTIRPELQSAAAGALGSRKGAAVAVDAGSGRILALVSTPSYDPSAFSGYASSDERAWKDLLGDSDKPMLNRALRDTVEPRETFHVVVAAAALEEGLYGSVDEATRAPLPYIPPGTTTELDADGAPCAHASIRTALRHACDNVFASIAVELGHSNLAATAEAFGFNDDAAGAPVRVAESTYPSGDVKGHEVALSGIGAGGVRVTPIKMAEVMAVIANGGRSVAPSVVDTVVLGDGTVQKPKDAAASAAPRRVIGRGTAEQLQSVIEDASGGKGAAGLTGWVASPTGSYGSEPTAWSVSYARDKSGRPIAMAVRVDGPGSGGTGDAGPAVAVTERMRSAVS